ncbi:MAG: hypothetical protein WCS96_09090 [Victivallales bacterium]
MEGYLLPLINIRFFLTLKKLKNDAQNYKFGNFLYFLVSNISIIWTEHSMKRICERFFHCLNKAFAALALIVVFIGFAVAHGVSDADEFADDCAMSSHCVCHCHINNMVCQKTPRVPAADLLSVGVSPKTTQSVEDPIPADIFRPPIA